MLVVFGVVPPIEGESSLTTVTMQIFNSILPGKLSQDRNFLFHKVLAEGGGLPTEFVNSVTVALGEHAGYRISPGGELEKLAGRYVYDMRTLIERIGQGAAESEPMSAPMSFLDTNFKYGTATITWNKEATAEYAESVRTGSDF